MSNIAHGNRILLRKIKCKLLTPKGIATMPPPPSSTSEWAALNTTKGKFFLVVFALCVCASKIWFAAGNINSHCTNEYSAAVAAEHAEGLHRRMVTSEGLKGKWFQFCLLFGAADNEWAWLQHAFGFVQNFCLCLFHPTLVWLLSFSIFLPFGCTLVFCMHFSLRIFIGGNS